MSEKEVVSATLSISVFVNCPGCDQYIDLMDPSDTSGVDHNECGAVVSQACPDGCWSTKHQEFDIEGVKCPVCSQEFDVKEIEW